MNRLPRWLVTIAIVVLSLITLIALFYAVEDWRGHQAWQSARAALEEKGEPLTFDEFEARKKAEGAIDVPAALEEWFDEERAAKWVDQLGELPDKPAAEDREAWADYLVEVQRRLAIAEPLVSANTAPIWVPIDPVNPHETLMPHLQPIMGVAKLSREEAAAGIALDRPELVLEAIDRLQRLRGWLKSPATLVEALVGLSLDSMVYELIEQGLERDLWSESERVSLGRWLEQSDPATLIAQGLRGERIFFVTISENLTPTRASELMVMFENGSQTSFWGGYVIGILPRGWLQQDLAQYALKIQEAIEALNQGRPPESELEGSDWKHPFTRMAAVAIDGVTERAMKIERQRQALLGLLQTGAASRSE